MQTLEYETTTGHKLTLIPVSPILLSRVETAVDMPDAPTYTVTTITGEVEKRAHDETTLSTDEERAAWKEYLEKLAEARETLRERKVYLILSRGVVLDVPEGWEDEQREMGIDIPEKPIDRKVHYILTELIGSQSDILSIMQGVYSLAGVNARMLEAAAASFRDQVEGPGAG